MTSHPHLPFALTARATGPRAFRLLVSGALDHQSADELTSGTERLLARRPAPTDLHLDFGRLTLCDSMGLSALLMIHRRAAEAGARLHLDRRPFFLDRLLALTCTLDHLTAPPASERRQARPAAETGEP
ncbi:STAS domain-containing protein [Streptomyces wuyuanensis]|uniref:STAS domain-containing protein n=1 Tax=Streptomyces wuyuanensis TaxID=1196353 RepID=UPI003D7556C5